MNGHPKCSLYAIALMLLHVIVSLWSHLSIPMMGRSQEHSMVLNTFLRNHTSYIHDKMIDASPALIQTIFMIMYRKMMCLSS
jgi:hypothetical protein